MNCPVCGQEMQVGSIVIRMDLETFLLLGASIMHAWFHPASGGEAQQVLTSNHPEHALRCQSCSAVVIASEDSIARGRELMELAQLVGTVGTAETPLCPMGSVIVDGKTYRAKSLTGFIERGEPIEVVSARLQGLDVRKSSTSRST